MAQHALAWAGQKNRDVVLYDTAAASPSTKR